MTDAGSHVHPAQTENSSAAEAVRPVLSTPSEAREGLMELARAIARQLAREEYERRKAAASAAMG